MAGKKLPSQTEPKRGTIHFSFLYCLGYSLVPLHGIPIHFCHICVPPSPVPIQNCWKINFLLWHFWFSSPFEFPPLHDIQHISCLYFQVPSEPRLWPCYIKMVVPSYLAQMWAVQAHCCSGMSPSKNSQSHFISLFQIPPSVPLVCMTSLVLLGCSCAGPSVNALAPSALPSVCIPCFPLGALPVPATTLSPGGKACGTRGTWLLRVALISKTLQIVNPCHNTSN